MTSEQKSLQLKGYCYVTAALRSTDVSISVQIKEKTIFFTNPHINKFRCGFQVFMSCNTDVLKLSTLKKKRNISKIF